MVFGLPFLRRRAPKKIPILTYHSLNLQGIEYPSNDHLALEEDLKLIRRLGFRVARLVDIARRTWERGASELDFGSWVGISFDDGVDYDYVDIASHPYLGDVKSFYRVLKESRMEAADLPGPSATSFVIASPEARSVLDRTCIAGLDQWRDAWWREAAETGILEIANHSWDHTHPTLERVAQRDQQKGTFNCIDTLADADAQIAQANEYIDRVTAGRATPLFAYPYGDTPNYLVEEYFPNETARHKMLAAFSTAGDYATSQSNRWKIPRFVCGHHWKDPEGLQRILRDA